MAAINFDATTVNPDSGFEPVPAGEYVAIIEDSEIKPTKAGTGMYLQLVWQVSDGNFKGRKIWDRINIQNPNQQAEEIGQKQLSAICHAVGVLRVVDSAELHDRPCVIKVIQKPAEGQYLASNEVKGYKSLQGGAPPAAAPAPQQQGSFVPPAAAVPAAPAAPAAAAAPPWARK